MKALALLLLLAAIIGCDSEPATHEVPFTANAPTPPHVAAAPYHFVWTDFHIDLGGTAVWDVRDGKVRDLFPQQRKVVRKGAPIIQLYFRLATYALTVGENDELRRAVASPAFFELDAAYIRPNLHDGTTQTFTVFIGDKKKDVDCYASWPRPIQRVRDTIGRIQRAHASDRRQAPEIDRIAADELRAEAKERGLAAGRKPFDAGM